MEKLRAKNTLAYGTIRTNRKTLPKNIKMNKNMKRGEHICRLSALDIAYFAWLGKKLVTLASNFHGNETIEVKQKQKDGTSLLIPCPEIIKDYNNNMGGEDHVDQLRTSYGLNSRAKKWWHRIFWGLIDITFVNAYVIYSKLFETIPLFDFRRSITVGLLASKNETPAKKRKLNFSVSDDVRLTNRNHWITFDSNRGHCQMCSIKKYNHVHNQNVSCVMFTCVAMTTKIVLRNSTTFYKIIDDINVIIFIVNI